MNAFEENHFCVCFITHVLVLSLPYTLFWL